MTYGKNCIFYDKMCFIGLTRVSQNRSEEETAYDNVIYKCTAILSFFTTSYNVTTVQLLCLILIFVRNLFTNKFHSFVHTLSLFLS